MKIIVLKDLENNCILLVSSMEYCNGRKEKRSEADIEKAITEFNMVHPDKQYKTINCSDEVYEAILFTLGEGQYKKAHMLEDVFLQLTILHDHIESIQSDLSGIKSEIVDTMDNVDNKIQEIKSKKKKGGTK